MFIVLKLELKEVILVVKCRTLWKSVAHPNVPSLVNRKVKRKVFPGAFYGVNVIEIDCQSFILVKHLLHISDVKNL